MPFVDIWVHLVFSTKYRNPHLESHVKLAVIDEIKAYGQKKCIHIDCLNGHIDHLHLLISLNQRQPIGEVTRLIKGYSSYWLSNKSRFKLAKFQWQDGYYAKSFSSKNLDSLRQYVINQEEHHKDMDFSKEVKLLGMNWVRKRG